MASGPHNERVSRRIVFVIYPGIVALDLVGPHEVFAASGAAKAALETLLGAYADETEHTGRIRVHIVDPGATRTRMRALAFPGEEPSSVKPPEVVAEAILSVVKRVPGRVAVKWLAISRSAGHAGSRVKLYCRAQPSPPSRSSIQP